MEPEEVLALMKRFFADKQPADVLASFPALSPRTLLKESLDVIDFVVYLEEELEREIDLQTLGAAIMNMNFSQLSVEVSRILAA